MATPLTVRYFAGARAAANGVSAEQAEADSLDALKQLLTDRHGERLGVVLKAASFLVDGLACHDSRAALPANATVDVLHLSPAADPPATGNWPRRARATDPIGRGRLIRSALDG